MTTLSPPQSPPHYSHEQTRPHQPRAVSSMSRASTSSRRSDHSQNKLDLTESSKDKRRLTLNTKADPSRAINEAQPAEVALEDANLGDLRKMQHKDAEGNLITDPDRANPTRPRMERPLDTIRSFNAAAEGTSRSRASSYHGRPMSAYGSEFGGNRRSSYYSNPSQVGYSPSPQRGGPRYSNGYGNGYGNGYYRNSSYGFPQENLEEMPDDRPYQPPPRQMRNPSNPNNQFYNQNGYRNGGVGYNNSINDSPMSGQHSYETMTSGSDENSKSTNPSSLNSSYDHLHQMQMRKQENHAYENQYSNDISFAPVSPQQPYANYNAPAVNGNAHQQNGNTHVRDYDPYSVPIAGPSNANGHYGAPRPPPEGMNPPNGLNPGTFNPPANNPKVPIKLNSPNSPPVVEEKKKRRSWLKRTFSRKKDF